MTKRLPLAFLAILLIVLLAGLGVAYGLWSETLTISGTVKTGNVDIAFVSPPTVTEYINGKLETDWPKEKWGAADCEASVSTDGNTLSVIAKGAYPSWTCKVTFQVISNGSVPVHVFKPQKQSGPEWKDLQISNCKKIAGKTEKETPDGEEACTATDLTKCPPPQYWQLHSGDKLQCELTIHFTNEDKVDQSSKYEFTYTVFGKQFNE
jgi:hypothetical protein